ncbi:hypothetical protein IRZ83_04510 [Flavobacterium sp. JLP]|uniref:hypothetical protein n=1 Tax=Flavobacterium sp. JLP TaxID=2783793 RepID=UPI00188AA75B|nr:hypothetical protein [Flavobacterium sp. JLP]MBF4505920.1 hypothetical protein [Flavobacterium sp. JLP]
MYIKNKRSTTLFKEQTLSTYLSNIELTLKNKIDRYTDFTLINLNVENESEKLIKELQLFVPKLIKESTTTSIKKESIDGRQLPSGSYFTPGKLIEIEIANYNIPTSGNNDFFKCAPNGFQAMEINVELNIHDINIQLTNYSIISGNDEAIEGLKNLLLKYIEIIEKYLLTIKTETEEFIPKMKENLVKNLTRKKENAILKDESNDKLNPFK